MKATTITEISKKIENIKVNEKGEKILYFSYTRASDREQGIKGMTVEAQRQEHMEWAERNDKSIAEFFVDNGYSARNLNRKDIQRMLRIISENKEFDGRFQYKIYIVIRYQSRLIRNLMLKRTLQIVFKKFNVEVICLEGTFESVDEGQQFGADIQTLMDENEIKRIAPRVIASYIQSAKMGNYPLGGKMKMGYMRITNPKYKKGSVAVLNPDTAPEVFKIFKLIQEKRPTIKQMVRFLNKNNILNVNWNSQKLLNILDDPIYYGRLQTKWFDSEDSKWGDDIKQDWYSMKEHTEPLVSKEIWEDVQKIIHRKNRYAKHNYYFKNMVYCKDCNDWMKLDCAWGAHSSRNLYKYYTCKHCKKRINENKIINDFIELYENFSLNDLKKQKLNKTKLTLERKKERLTLINKLFDEGEMERDEWLEERVKAKKEILDLDKEIRNITNSSNVNFNHLNYSQKKHIIRTFLDRVEISFDPKRIDFILSENKRNAS